MSLDPMAYGVPDPSLTFLPEPVDIRTSCNGLLCCQGPAGYQAYYICNALVCAVPSELGGYEFDIYSSEKGSWRTSGEIYFGDRKLLPKSGVHVNGTVYWLSSQGVIAFDLTSERSQILSFASRGIMNGALDMMNGQLCVAYVLGRSLYVSVLSNSYSNTMRLRSDARTWVKIRSDINLDTSYQFSSRYGHGLGSVVFVSGDTHGVASEWEHNIFLRHEEKGLLFFG
ncbi:hypothetical protein QQP08_007731 [Theobroma cacao]|nr:hypothetical protein QQP08_007731 [Theobroma cacao]